MGYLLIVLCWLGAVLPALAADASSAAVPGADWYQEQRLLYAGIPLQVRFTPADPAIAAAVWRQLEEIDQVFNDWKDSSEIGRINAGGAGVYTVSPDLADCLVLARRVNQLTEGAFDLTVGPLRRLWRGAETSGVLPTAEQLTAVRAALGPQTWDITGRTLTVRVPGVRFDPGGLVKGLSVDRALLLLRQAGASAALVQSGGETGCFGLSPHGVPHRLGIPDPDAPDQVLTTIHDRGTGLCGSTSGNYRQPVQIGDRTFYHIYDPRTGQPCDVRILSVSVVFPGTGRNALADGLTKGGVVNGAAWILAAVTRLGGDALVLERGADGAVVRHATAGWAQWEGP
jgi:thiamine biosynthesis lipoprotein